MKLRLLNSFIVIITTLIAGCSNNAVSGGGGIETVALTIPVPTALRQAGASIVATYDSFDTSSSIIPTITDTFLLKDTTKSVTFIIPIGVTIHSIAWKNNSSEFILAKDLVSSSDTNQSSPKAWLLVQGQSDLLDVADNALRDHLMNAGFIVVPQYDSILDIQDTSGISAICISTSVDTARIGALFRTVNIPILSNEHYLLDDLGMCGPHAKDSIGLDINYTTAQIATPSHPVAAGLSGSVIMIDTLGHCDWGIPGNAATIILTSKDSLSHSSCFIYESGSLMPGLAAPARRAAFCFWTRNADRLTAEAWTIFNAVARWVAADMP